jgi:hypothetical protein
VASEVIDRRVVMISLFATTFLRSPRHRRRLAFRNRQVPSLEVGDVLHLLRCCHAVQRIAWTRTDHRSLRRNSFNTDGASCIAATRNAPSSYNNSILASHAGLQDNELVGISQEVMELACC